MKLFILSGNFKRGSVALSEELILKTGAGFEIIPALSIARISTVAADGSARISGMAAGGIVGGITAGVMAGGLTGPAGAIIGGLAGATFARGKALVCRVEFRDGRYFVASGSKAAWNKLQSMAQSTRQM
jgi:hypothetical protein